MKLLLPAVCLLFILPAVARAQKPDLPPPAARYDHLDQYAGRPLQEITFESWINLSYGDLLETTGLTPGQRFDIRRLEEAVARLLERKAFRSVVPEVEALDEGLHLRFQLEPKQIVADVSVVGQDSLLAREIRRLARIRPGVEATAVDLQDARARILAGYRKMGHYSAEVRYVFEQKVVPSWLELVIVVEENYRSKIDKVELEGTLPEDVASIRERLKRDAVGTWASEQNIERLRKNTLLALRREGYLQASVELLESTYQPLSGDLDVRFRATTREPISIIFRGNTVFSPKELLSPLKLESRTVPFTPNAMITLAREIERLYQQHGYYRATAQPVKLGAAASRKLFRIDIDEGRRFRIESVKVRGNTAFSVGRIREEIATAPAYSWPLRRWNPGFLQYDQLESDVENIKTLYSSAGFFDARVDYEFEADEENNTLAVFFRIEEGPQRVVQEVDMQWRGVVATGLEGGVLPIDIPGDLLTIQSTVEEGDEFNREKLRDEQRRLYEEVVQLGYPNASVELQGDANRGSVRFVITPGPRIRVGRIVHQGNILTKDYVIDRELKLSPGEPWDIRAIEQTKLNLASLGFFRSVVIEPLDGTLEERVEDLAVNVVERDTGRFEIGGGFTTEDGIHLFSEVGQRNLFGHGKRVLFGMDGYFKSGGERIFDAGRIRAAYAVPRVFDTSMEFSSEAFIQSSVKLVDQFSYDRIGGWLSLNNPLTEEIEGLVGITGYDERLFDVDRDVIIGEDDRGRTFFLFLQTRLDLDYRDNSFNPRSGWRSLLDARVTSEAFGSQVDFYELGYQQSLLFEVARPLVWANRIRWSYLEPFGGTEVIPISHRVFLGGRSSLRGFSKNSVGPRGKELNIVGGDRGFNATTELRYDVTEVVVGLLFLDFGQAFLANEGRFRGDTLDFGDTRFSPGFGVHYTTPIGPIRAEYGIALDRELGERFGRINISIGTAF